MVYFDFNCLVRLGDEKYNTKFHFTKHHSRKLKKKIIKKYSSFKILIYLF